MAPVEMLGLTEVPYCRHIIGESSTHSPLLSLVRHSHGGVQVPSIATIYLQALLH